MSSEQLSERGRVIASRIRAAREALGMTQRGLVAEVGIHGWTTNQSVLAKVELGQRGVSAVELDAIARALHVAPGVFFAESPHGSAVLLAPHELAFHLQQLSRAGRQVWDAMGLRNRWAEGVMAVLDRDPSLLDQAVDLLSTDPAEAARAPGWSTEQRAESFRKRIVVDLCDGLDEMVETANSWFAEVAGGEPDRVERPRRNSLESCLRAYRAAREIHAMPRPDETAE